MNYTYIIKCADSTLYTGWTNDLDKRIKAHNSGKGAKYTKTRRPVKLVYYEEHETKNEAMSREYAKRHNGHRIRIPVPDRLKDKTIQEVRICPMYGGRYFKIQYCYLKEPEPVKASPDRVLAIDLGLDNLAACVTNTGTSFLMDGRKLKSINQYWNKQKAYMGRLDWRLNVISG